MSSFALPSLRRPVLRLLALIFLLVAVPVVHASTITYNVTLTPSSDGYGGSGTITLASSPAIAGISTFSQANGQLQNLTFTIDNQTFSLAGYPSATVEFLDGQLYNISFAQTIGTSPNRFTLDTSGVYAFYYNNGQSESDGSIAATPADFPDESSSTEQSAGASATPEPGSIILLATALLGGGFLVFRRARHSQS